MKTQIFVSSIFMSAATLIAHAKSAEPLYPFNANCGDKALVAEKLLISYGVIKAQLPSGQFAPIQGPCVVAPTDGLGLSASCSSKSGVLQRNGTSTTKSPYNYGSISVGVYPRNGNMIIQQKGNSWFITTRNETADKQTVFAKELEVSARDNSTECTINQFSWQTGTC